MFSQTRICLVVFIALVVAVTGVTSVSTADEMTVEEVVARHLESIGTSEARAANKSRVMQGSVLATVRIGGKGHSQGGSVMASQGSMSLIGMIFGPQEYSNEKAAYDGKRLTLGELNPGNRTNLGGFLLTHDIVFKEGLIGGTLSTAWPLLDLNSRRAKLKYGGRKKMDGRQTHMIRYETRNGNLQIRLYFDAENFRHVRTEYQQDIAPPPVSDPALAARQKETHLKLTEDFSEFKVEGGLMLPHVYKLQLTFDTSNNPLLQDWVLTLNQFLFNKEIDPKQFDLTIK
jgi:hypothetical protein